MENRDTETYPLLTPLNHRQQNQTTTVVFNAESNDISPITGAGEFAREFLVESKKLWYLAGPAMFTSIAQYSLGAVTQVFAGHVGTLQLAAVTVENSVIAGFCLGITVILKFCLISKIIITKTNSYSFIIFFYFFIYFLFWKL